MENANLEIMSAETFYEKTIITQLQLVNKAITMAMQRGLPVIKLPTQLYETISSALQDVGWSEDIMDDEMYKDYGEGVSWIYPACLHDESAYVESTPEVTMGQNTLIPAQTFYEATLKNQKRELYIAMNEAVDMGLSEVKLNYIAYPALVNEMKRAGWEHVIWYADLKTKEECSMFYPICDFI